MARDLREVGATIGVSLPLTADSLRPPANPSPQSPAPWGEKGRKGDTIRGEKGTQYELGSEARQGHRGLSPIPPSSARAPVTPLG